MCSSAARPYFFISGITVKDSNEANRFEGLIFPRFFLAMMKCCFSAKSRIQTFDTAILESAQIERMPDTGFAFEGYIQQKLVSKKIFYIYTYFCT